MQEETKLKRLTVYSESQVDFTPRKAAGPPPSSWGRRRGTQRADSRAGGRGPGASDAKHQRADTKPKVASSLQEKPTEGPPCRTGKLQTGTCSPTGQYHKPRPRHRSQRMQSGGSGSSSGPAGNEHPPTTQCPWRPWWLGPGQGMRPSPQAGRCQSQTLTFTWL